MGSTVSLDVNLRSESDIAAATAQLRAEHERETSALQRAVDSLTGFVGWPGFVAVLIVVMGMWVAANVLAGLLRSPVLDPPPFFWLQGVVGAGALCIAALILTTQRREDQLASHREQLMLELAILNDQKTSKIIQLLLESRQDNPMMSNRADNQADAMSTPSDPQSVLDAIKEVD